MRIAIWRRNKYQQYLSSNKFQCVTAPRRAQSVRFIRHHSDAVGHDLGAGLDTRAFRIAAPATVDWYDVDYPTVVAARERLIPDYPTAVRLYNRLMATSTTLSRKGTIVLVRIFRTLLDENAFLSPHGLRALSKRHSTP